MKHTLLAITSSLFAISMLVSACGKANESDKLKEIQKNEEITVNGDHEYDKPFASLNEIMNQTDLVVTARLESKESFDNHIWRYSLIVKENHYGRLETGTPAYLYGKADLLEDNQDYLMFLQADTLPLYPHLVLALTHEELLIPVNITSDIILGSTHLASSIDALTTMLSKQEGNKNHISYDPQVARNVSDVVNNSDEILLVQIEQSEIINPYVSAYHVRVRNHWMLSENHSNQTDVLTLALPPGLKEGLSYYLALKREEGNLILAASGMTVMPTDSQEAKELLSIISP